MKKSLRKQIKQDELVTGYEQVGSWARQHLEELRATAIGAVVLLVVVAGLLYFRSHRLSAAQAAFAQAFEVFSAPVAQAGQPAPAGSFTSQEERQRKALTAFDGVAQRYGGQEAGQRARYFAALCRIDLGDYATAERDLREIAKGDPRRRPEPSLARLALAGLLARKGSFDEAVNEYKAILAEPASSLPKDHVLISLAATLEKAGRPEEAAAAFRQVVQEFPTGPYAAEARTRSDYLKLAQR